MSNEANVIDLKEVFRASPNGLCPFTKMRNGTSSDANSAQFILGYLCAIAFKLGMTPDEIQGHYRSLRKEFGARHVPNWGYADRLHKIIEERIAQLPTTDTI